MQNYSITPQLREELKNPLGQLIKDSQVNQNLIEQIFRGPNAITVCVGDRTTERIHGFGFTPNLEIIDHQEKRIPRPAAEPLESTELMKTVNSPGSISHDALEKIKSCLDLILKNRSISIRLEVLGEEDLLALPIMAFYPDETVTFYGQPNEGLVIVSSEKAREISKGILRQIGILSLP